MKIGIIGGSGADGVIEALGVEARFINERDKGIHGVDYIEFQHGDDNVYFILRHGKDHSRSPADLDPRDIVNRLDRLMGTDDSERLIIQTSASGSLDTSIRLVDEGGIVVCLDVMRGFGFNAPSYSGKPYVAESSDGKKTKYHRNLHAVMAKPFSQKARQLALDAIAKIAAEQEQTEIEEAKRIIGYDGGIYVNNQGNQFETAAEVADLYMRLISPKLTLGLFDQVRYEAQKTDDLRSMTDRFEKEQEGLDYIRQTLARVAENLTPRYATLSMNAARELPVLKEAGFNNVVLLSFPVNYGVGLVPDEQVDHQRTIDAITNATKPYIVPVLKNMIEMAEQYMR
ncbi:MAG: hypothetical protein ABIG89_02935 [Candidatus Woesearchaeota archaeon]